MFQRPGAVTVWRVLCSVQCAVCSVPCAPFWENCDAKFSEPLSIHKIFVDTHRYTSRYTRYTRFLSIHKLIETQVSELYRVSGGKNKNSTIVYRVSRYTIHAKKTDTRYRVFVYRALLIACVRE